MGSILLLFIKIKLRQNAYFFKKFIMGEIKIFKIATILVARREAGGVGKWVKGSKRYRRPVME